MSVYGATVAGSKAQMGKCVSGEKLVCITEKGGGDQTNRIPTL